MKRKILNITQDEATDDYVLYQMVKRSSDDEPPLYFAYGDTGNFEMAAFITWDGIRIELSTEHWLASFQRLLDKRLIILRWDCFHPEDLCVVVTNATAREIISKQ